MMRWSSHRAFHQARDANDDATIFGHAFSNVHLTPFGHLEKRAPPNQGGTDEPLDTSSFSDSSSSSSDSSSSDSSSSSSSDTSSDSSSSSTSSNSSDCPPGSKCDTKITTNTNTLAIVLGVVLPLTAALVVFVYLHRKHVRKTRLEELNDKHGSLDFGLGESRRAKQKGNSRFGKRNQPEMSTVTTEKMIRGRGMSMDMGSPYVMSEEIARSRPSLHSQREAEDPYGPVKLMRERSKSPMPPTRSATESSDHNPLLKNIQSPSRNSPPYASTVNTRSSSPVQSPNLNIPQPSHSVTRKPIGSAAPITPRDPLPSPPPPPPPAKDEEPNAAAPTFNLPNNVDEQPPPANNTTDPTIISRQSPTPPIPERGDSKAPRTGSIHAKVDDDALKDYAYYTEGLGISHNQGPSPGISREQTPGTEDQGNGLVVPSFNDPRRLSASMRPLPPDHPEDNPEQRANRIRSFYREYFDDSKPDYSQPGYGDYYEDYGQEFLNDATFWDEQTGQFITAGAPYGEPLTRRAMTPPPRGPPRFRPGQGHRYTSSSGHSHGGRVRAYSTASGRPHHPQGARGRPVKRLPPPQALSTLATPHLIGNDPSTFSTIDFAPPQSMRDRVAGRSESPRMESRPYSPSVRAHTPLVPSFNELTPMPSPHAMRKSGTFTALDFAPPPRFRNNDGASDAGSIRSGRSGYSNISAIAQHNVRKGTYRISRLPKETVGTKDDLASTLKPQWDMNR